MAKFLVTLSTEKIEEILIEADTRDEVEYLLSSGVGQVVKQWNYASHVEMVEEVDA